MRYNALPLVILVLLITYLCTVSAVEEGAGDAISIRHTTLSLRESAGKFARARIIVVNNLNHSVDVRVKELTGEIIQAIPSIDKARTTLAPGETKEISLNGYILKDTKAGDYEGELILIGDDVEYRVSVKLTVPGSENISLILEITPLQREIRPGQTLKVRSDIKWAGERLDLLYSLWILNPETGEEKFSKRENITVWGAESITTEFEIPADIKCREYTILGTLYSPILSEEMASSTASVSIKKSLFPVIEIPGLTAAQIQMVFIGLVLLAVLFLMYFHHRREAAKKKRYLESIDFTTLPRKGPERGFIGRIAETSVVAFIDLNQLQIHALIAGATGTGKTVAAQVLAEEALTHKKSVLVFDPTAQWTGFLRKNKDKGMFNLYKHFRMKEKDARAFNGNVYTIKDPNERIDVKKYMNPGEISVFCLNRLDPSMIDVFVENTIKDVFATNLEESPELKVLFVYDEIHRLLPKFGGAGRGLLQIDRAVREFRKWGIGLILISQVLSDFVGEIKANIGTEIQLRTRYESDLERVRLKYGADTFKSVVKASVGTGMLQNAQYNKGRPYFISFRPLLHNPRKLDNQELELYDKFNARLNILRKKIEILKKSDVDTFNIELELGLAQENLSRGSFTVVDLYLTSLASEVEHYIEKLKSNEITEKEKAICSEWEIKKGDELKAYTDELEGIIEEQKGSLSDKEKLLTDTERREKENLEMEKKKIPEEEARVKKELEILEHKLESRSQLFRILNRFQERIEILNAEVMKKEKKKLRAGESELELTKGKETERLLKKKEGILLRERKTMAEIEAEKKYLEDEAYRLRKRLEEIHRDREMILEKDEMITGAEERLKSELMDKIQTGFEEKKEIEDKLLREEDGTRKGELETAMRKVVEKIQENRDLIKEQGRTERGELKGERDTLRNQLTEMREKWKCLLRKEQEMVENEEELNKRMREQERLLEAENSRMQEIGKDWEKISFEDMEDEWDKMDRIKGEKARLEQEMAAIREDLRKSREMRSEGEEEIREKEEKLKGLEGGNPPQE